jgi:hypothetical protein
MGKLAVRHWSVLEDGLHKQRISKPERMEVACGVKRASDFYTVSPPTGTAVPRFCVYLNRCAEREMEDKELIVYF